MIHQSVIDVECALKSALSTSGIFQIMDPQYWHDHKTAQTVPHALKTA
jgi:hypothetical protein